MTSSICPDHIPLELVQYSDVVRPLFFYGGLLPGRFFFIYCVCITRVFVVFFIVDTAGPIASNQLRLENITNCHMIELRFMHPENDHSYDLQKLIDDTEMDQAVTLQLYRDRIESLVELRLNISLSFIYCTS